MPLAGGAAGGPVEGGARDVWMGDVNGMAFEPNGNLLFTHADRSASFVCRIKLFD